MKSGLNIAYRGRRERHTRKNRGHLENLGLNMSVILKQTWEEIVCGGGRGRGVGCVNWTDLLDFRLSPRCK